LETQAYKAMAAGEGFEPSKAERGIYSPNQGQTLAQHSQISRGK
jgi:hypothetical protein